MNKNLFELGAEAKALEDLIEEYAIEHEGVLDDGAAALFDKWQEETQGNIEAKVDAICAVIHKRGAFALKRRALAAPHKEEADRLLGMAKVDENTVERLKRYLVDALALQGKQKIETVNNKLSVCRNSSVPVKLRDGYTVDNIPRAFLKVEVDNTAITAALKAGEKLDFAEFGEPGKHIRGL